LSTPHGSSPDQAKDGYSTRTAGRQRYGSHGVPTSIHVIDNDYNPTFCLRTYNELVGEIHHFPGFTVLHRWALRRLSPSGAEGLVGLAGHLSGQALAEPDYRVVVPGN
jgi:hypothetical protein